MNKRRMNKFKFFIGTLFIITLMLVTLNSSILFATENNETSTEPCKHTVYEDINNSRYHYTYCNVCGKAKKRTVHRVYKIVNNENTTTHLTYCSCGMYMGVASHSYVSYSKYNVTYHYATCSCGYTGLKSHNVHAEQLENDESVNGVVYSGIENLDKYHKTVCSNCDTVTGVDDHDWTGGDTSAHTCSRCSYVHSKKDDATHGLHYFEIEKIRVAGYVAPCKVCNEALRLEYTDDNILSTLPKKEEYTMVGNPNPMKEKSISKDQQIKANFMPINENGELIPLDDLMLRVRTYTHGNYYAHYSKLMGSTTSLLNNKVKYIENGETIEYIVSELNSLGNLGGGNEDKATQIVSNISNKIKDDPNIGFIDTYALTTVISQFGDFAVGAINSPLIEWFAKDYAVKSTWLGGGVATLRHEFKGSMEDSNNRIFTVYFSELPAGKYEILMSPLLTYGVNFNLFSYSLGGLGTMLYSTLFNVGGSGGEAAPSNIKAYIGVAYRDTNGNIIRNKKGEIATPIDAIISNIVYSGTSAKSVTKTITAKMDWTQNAGYRYKGYLVKYGASSGGNYSMYNNPSEMTVTTESSVSVTSSFSYSGLGISLVFYFEPVNIIKVEHIMGGDKKIDTNKNLGFIPFPTSTDYDVNDVNYAPKAFESLNKNFWPGYILTGYTVYSESVSSSNIILKKSFDVDTTTKMNSKDDAKRKALIWTAITSASDTNGGTIVNKEKVGYGKDKIVIFNYLYPEVEIKNLNYKTNALLKSLDGENLEYKIKLIGDNMLVKSLDTTKPKNGYNELNLNLSDGTFKNFKYDVSNFSLVQAYIYTKDLNRGTKTLYKVIAGNDSFIPSGIPSNKVQKANDFSSFANMYILNTEELLTVMNKVWSDLYIEFKYFEGANVVNVSYVDEEGNVLMPPEVYKILDEGYGSYTATIPVTPIDGYELVKYVLDDKEEKNVSTLEKVNIVDNGNDRELIYVYRKRDREDIIPDIYENPMAIIRSNNRDDEEYNVDIAMPTDEDLYANVITDSYVIENVLSVLNKTQKVNVILKKKYYTSNNDDDSAITSNIDIASATIPLEYDLDYSYMGGANSNLFILENAIIENEAVFDKKHYEENGKVFIKADYKDKIPYLTYIPGGKLFIEDSEECRLIRDGDVYYLEVTLSGIDYEEPDMNAIANSYKNNHEVIDQIIRKNATVNGDYLSVTAEETETKYLDGNYIYMSADRLANVLELSSAGYYFISSKVPLTNRDVLYNNRNVYTYSKAQNIRYDSTKLTVKYILHQGVRNLVVTNLSGENAEDAGVDNIQRVKEYTPSDIKMNYIKIYTPIVNYTELIPLNNSNQNDNQLIDTSIQNVLTLDSVFSILIPHSGDHIYARFEDGSIYNGYGIKDYNFNGSRLYDEIDFSDKGLKPASFAKMKLIKFTFDVYALKYLADGKSIKYQKFIPANTWFSLGEIDSNTGLSLEKYNFIIPTWVKDKEYGDIKVRIVAGNIPDAYDPKADETSGEDLSYIVEDVANKDTEYILEKNFKVYIAGVLYDLEIRDSDDNGWMGKLKTALKLKNSIVGKNMFLPIGQSNQNSLIAYKLGLKLGYRFYFDLKTKGIASDEIEIKPNFYYVSADGKTVTKDISLFYNTKDSKYVKLNDENDLNVKFVMSSTHGKVNNDKFTFELVKGKLNNPSKDYTAVNIIGKVFKGLNMLATDSKLPQDNILESANLYGYKGNITKFIEDAKLSEIVENEDTIRNSAGHFYGEFYLPASTKVALGSSTSQVDVIKNKELLLTDGYIVVTFDEIITKSNSEKYLTYDNPTSDSRWVKEGATYEPYEINLPNGNKAKMDGMTKGAAMAIYEANLRANDDYETEGTH